MLKRNRCGYVSRLVELDRRPRPMYSVTFCFLFLVASVMYDPWNECYKAYGLYTLTQTAEQRARLPLTAWLMGHEQYQHLWNEQMCTQHTLCLHPYIWRPCPHMLPGPSRTALATTTFDHPRASARRCRGSTWMVMMKCGGSSWNTLVVFPRLPQSDSFDI